MKKPILSIIVFYFLLSVIFFAVPITGAHSSGYTPQILQGNMTFKVGQNYSPHDYIEITSDADLNQTALDEGWPGTGVENDPYIIKNYLISDAAPSLSASIVITNVNQHVVVKNNMLSSSSASYMGVYIQSSNNVSVIDNEIQNYMRAVIVEFSKNITVKSNLITNNGYGIYVYDTEDGLFASNTITNCSSYAISIYQSATINFHSNIIRFSNLFDTYDFNIISETDSLILFNNSFEKSNFGYSLYLIDINQAQITWNQFCDPAGFLVLFNSNGNNITKNEFSNTGNVPNLSLEQSTNNIISSNNFYTQSTSHNHVFIVLSGNLFFNNERGNYWSKYTGNDTDGNGIGDEPFEIDASNKDDYPLVKPVDLTKPEITDYPADLSFTTDENVSITWTAFDQNPTTYNLYQDGTLAKTGPFDNGTNTIELEQFDAGTYLFTVTLYDKDANTASFTTTVIISSAPESQTSESQTSEGQASEEILNFISENIVQIAGVTIIAGVSLFILLKVLRRIRS